MPLFSQSSESITNCWSRQSTRARALLQVKSVTQPRSHATLHQLRTRGICVWKTVTARMHPLAVPTNQAPNPPRLAHYLSILQHVQSQPSTWSPPPKRLWLQIFLQALRSTTTLSPCWCNPCKQQRTISPSLNLIRLTHPCSKYTE